MKTLHSIRVPLPVTLLIGLIVIALGWRGNRQLDQLRDDHRQLLEHTRALDRPPPLSAQTPSKGEKDKAERIARSFIACGIEFKDCSNLHALRKLDLASRDRLADAIEGVMSLDLSELEALIRTLAEDPELHYKVRRDLLTFSLARWGAIDPRKLLDHLARSEDLKKPLGPGYLYLVRTTLSRWINESPDAVMQWMKESRGTLPEDITGPATSHFAQKIASEDPLETFEFINEFSPRPHSYFPYILRRSELAAEDRAEAIARIREMATSLEDTGEKQRFIHKNLEAFVLSQQTHQADFQTAIDTIEAANLGIDDIEFIWNPAISDLGYHIVEEQAGDWILWLRDNIPTEKSKHRVKLLLRDWKERDAQAATAFIEQHQLSD